MSLWRVVRYLKPYRWKVALIFFLMALTTGLQMLNPRILGHLLDYAEYRAGLGFRWVDFRVLLLGGSAILSIVVGRGFLHFWQTSTAGKVGQSCLYDLRNDLYQHLQTLSYSFFDKTQTGQLLSRVTADVESLRMFLGHGFINIFTQALTLAALIIVTFALNWRLALLSLGIMPLMALAVYKLAFVVRPAYLRIQQQIGVMNEHLQESLAGVRTVKAAGQAERRAREFTDISQEFVQRTITQVRLRSKYSPSLEFLTGVATVGVLWYGGTMVAAGSLSFGSLMSFVYYLRLLIHPMRMLGFQIGSLQQAVAAADRIFEILDAVPEIKDAENPVQIERPRGHLVFDNVSFSYANGRPVLRNINLDVPPGALVALVGGAGSGKTSLVNMIPRFYDPSAGVIKLDGVDLKDMSLAGLRRHVGVVAQDPYLYSLSLRENIAFGRADASMDAIVAAAKTAQIHDFIMSLPNGYETIVGERGIGLSGGQRQRVAIARALLTDPVILILDDSLSAVDTETEHRLQQALESAMATRTTFVIAHRLSSVERADIIVVLEDGRIVQTGRHSELVLQVGPYRDIYLTQLVGDEEDEMISDMDIIPAKGV